MKNCKCGQQALLHRTVCQGCLTLRREELAQTGSPGACACGKAKIPGRSFCLDCRNARNKERYQNDPDWRNQLRQRANANYKPNKRREMYAEVKGKAYEILGGFSCKRCGFSDHRALQIDHVNGDGYTVRKSKGEIGEMMYKQVILMNGEGFQVLCANCNWIKKSEEGHMGGAARTRLDKYPAET